jgi:hypothetical protein
MRPFRAPRRLAAILAIASVVFAQAAVAMYACTLSSPAEAAAAMSCHDEAPAPNALCNAHCLADEQTVDQAKALASGDVSAPLLAVVEAAIAVPPLHAVRSEPVLAHAASPPLTILYQRLRN